MLIIPENVDPTYRIIGIDPGSDTMGIAVVDVNLVELTAVVCEAFTVSGNRLARSYTEVNQVHGDLVARLVAHEENLSHLFRQFRPHCVIAEAPYMGRFPQAYAALMQCIGAIRRAVMQYSSALELEMIDPMSVKKAVGASDQSQEKAAVMVSIRSLPDLSYRSGLNPAKLDSHSSDAVAVAYYKYQGIKKI